MLKRPGTQNYMYRVDGIVALQILADAAKSDVRILKTLQNLARGTQPKPPVHLQSENGTTGSLCLIRSWSCVRTVRQPCYHTFTLCVSVTLLNACMSAKSLPRGHSDGVWLGTHSGQKSLQQNKQIVSSNVIQVRPEVRDRAHP